MSLRMEGTAMTIDPYALPENSFVGVVGLRLDRVEGSGLATVVHGRLEVDERHHTPWGVVHGGVWCSVVESAATVGACAVIEAEGRFAVGVDNLTDFLRPVRSGSLDVTARPEQIGRSLQLWQVEVVNADGKTVARGRVRLANQELPTS
jgi:1,4-dihydroxy-2-naphthoyl-CoA hydrolase